MDRNDRLRKREGHGEEGEPVINEDDGLRGMLAARIQAAVGRMQWIPGIALGPSPRYFIVGDMPMLMDFASLRPFCGPARDLLTKCLIALEERYGARPEEAYATYLAKVRGTAPPREADILDIWLPILRLEYKVSGCERVVCVGPVSRQYAHLIAAAEPEPGPRADDAGSPDLAERVTHWLCRKIGLNTA